MKAGRFQFGITAILCLVVISAINYWMFTLGVFWAVLAVVLDKHVLVAYLCMLKSVDQRPGPLGG